MGINVKEQKPKVSVLEQLVSYHTSLDDAKNSDKPIRYVMCKDGVKEIRKNEIGLFAVDAKDIPGLKSITSGFHMALPKIPYDLYLQTLSFFRCICKEMNDAEAAVQIFWDRDKKEYFLHCPKQEVSKSNVKWDRDHELEAKHLLVMDIHSHKQCA